MDKKYKKENSGINKVTGKPKVLSMFFNNTIDEVND
jgi:hypothetical protein